MKNLKNLWKTISHFLCPNCKAEVFNVTVEIRYLPEKSILECPPTKRVRLQCAKCHKEFDVEAALSSDPK